MRARGGHVHRQNISLIIKKTYGWLGSVVQTMEDFLFLRKYRSRETARPCSGSIYANQLRDGKRMARKQNSNQIGVQHTARILSRYQCARAGGTCTGKIYHLIIKKTYGWLGSVVQTMEDFLFLRKYRSRETARPCSGSIYANQLRDGKRMARKQNSNQIGVQHTARILSRYQCARARGHVHRQNISLIIKKTYGWLGSVVQTMEDFLFLRKYRSRETARPCSGSIYANQLRDGKRMARKQNSNQIGVQHTARILSRYQCARAGGTFTGKIYHL